jgi:hypothetical protein
MYNSSLSLCPRVSCDRTTVDTAFSYLRSNNCSLACTSECGSYFLQLTTVHDLCQDSLMTTAEEDEYHNSFETPCSSYRCNDITTTESLACTPSSASTVAVAVASTIVAVVCALLAM